MSDADRPPVADLAGNTCRLGVGWQKASRQSFAAKTHPVAVRHGEWRRNARVDTTWTSSPRINQTRRGEGVHGAAAERTTSSQHTWKRHTRGSRAYQGSDVGLFAAAIRDELANDVRDEERAREGGPDPHVEERVEDSHVDEERIVRVGVAVLLQVVEVSGHGTSTKLGAKQQQPAAKPFSTDP